MLAIFQWLSRDEIIATRRLIFCDTTVSYLQGRTNFECVTEIFRNYISSAVDVALLMAGRKNILDYVPFIRCENLPCQPNSTDCGCFTAMCAELLTTFIDWKVGFFI
ncbi:hypothetical protein DICVIV_14362 [Dictyocaulus viviparus]|uniref:Uncharacterized protein n=1 Tax=Dictyocaulus viviparus TaxID=29172 RepID=A0A0D8X5E9_DICVI|nr:hypothetical protein DICVIV_14362 [Dictyocaulus viviparus]